MMYPSFADKPLELSIIQRVTEHAKAHPYSTAAAATGLVVSGASLAAQAALGWAGFTSVGPAAGSYAAGWQASIGLVNAGSPFAWCQSAAMGGAAAAQVTSVGVAGAGVAAVAGGVGLGQAAMKKSSERLEENPDLIDKFRTVYRTAESAQMESKEKVDAGSNKQ
ncbi:MAG: hypothetical protein Q9160_007096 [Pyrenula sp. 1 TL-2023]